MAFSNTPEPADTLDAETDSGVPAETITRGSDCPDCVNGSMTSAYFGRYLRCCECGYQIEMEIDYE